MQHKKLYTIYIGLSILLLLLFIADVSVGTTNIHLADALRAWWHNDSTLQSDILLHYRLPKSIVAVMVGISLSISGLQMQTLFRNPLADPYILGISAGAGLGVALFVLGKPLFVTSAWWQWGQAFAAWVGAVGVALLLVLIAGRVRSIMTLLILGVILGSAVSALINLLQYFGEAASLKSYVLWTMGNVGNVSQVQLLVLCAITAFGSIVALLSHNTLNALMLGEEYARSIGYNVSLHRTLIIFTATLLTGAAVAFCGPIGFIGIAVPHIARMILQNANHRYLLPATMLTGACVLLLCDTLSQLPGNAAVLPINTITALLGIPIVIFVILRNRL